jgi:hypothetical protein
MEQTEINASAQAVLTEYTIIEDCSPYYIRFTFPKLELVIDHFQKQLANIPANAPQLPRPPNRSEKYNPLHVGESSFRYVKAVVPFWSAFKFDVPMFAASEKGLRFPIHRDSAGINFMIEALDEECITSWYSEESVAHLTPLDNTTKTKSQMFNMSDTDPRPVPIKTAVFKPNECVLFNGAFWHDWDNSKSQNRRVNLLWRSSTITLSFDEIRKKLFGY